MKKLALQLAAVLVAFVALGITNASKATQEIPEFQVKANIPSGWQKVIERKFSLYLPPDVEQWPEDPPVGAIISSWEGSNRFCSSAGLVVAYTWFKHKKGEMACAPFPTLENEGDQSSEIKVADKWARLNVWNNSVSEANSGSTALCFDDIGDDETGLYLYVSNGDKGALSVASQIFDSIEFR